MLCTRALSLLISFLTLFRICQADGAESSGPREYRNKVPVSLVWATEGEDVELPCDITPPTPNDFVSMVLWFKDSVGIPLYSLDARKVDMLSKAIHWVDSDNLGNRTYFQIADGHRARLKIHRVTPNDQGVFRCRVDFVDSPTRNFRVNLTLIEKPSKPVIYNAQGREVIGVGGPFLEGYDLLLICQVSGGKPKPSVTWWKDDELLDGVVDVPVVAGTSTSRFTVNHLFIAKVTRSLWGSKLECRAQSGPMQKPIIREVPLDIYLKPAIVKIIINEEHIYAGRAITARCETWGSSPAARIIWKLGGLSVGDPGVATTQRSNSTVSKVTLVLQREDDGKELTCRAENPRFPGGVLEETRILHVSYAPVVSAHLASGYILDTLREGDDLKLVCNVRSNPSPSTIVWYHDDTKLEHDVTAGILVASNTLTLRVLTLVHSGAYSCEARNPVGVTQSEPVLIHMKYAPRCREGLEYLDIPATKHEAISLRCEVEAVPDDTVRFSWTFNGTRGDVVPPSNSKTVNKGLISILEYTPITDASFGTLACWASNTVGRQRTPCIFNIIPAKTPQPPLDCSLHNESSSLAVNCIPGSDGGLPQHFLLEVRGLPQNSGHLRTLTHTLQTPQSDQGEAGEVPAIYQEINPIPNFRLHDLHPGYDYTLAVYAVNERGKSEPAVFQHIRVHQPLGGKLERNGGVFLDEFTNSVSKRSAQSMIIVVALIGAAALILVGIGVVIGLAICRKRNRPQPLREPDDFTTPSYVPAQRIEPRVRYSSERRQSQRTSLYIEENRIEPDLLQQIEIDLQS